MTAAPSFRQDQLAIVEQVLLARDTWRLRLEAPALAARIRPGQFVMLRLPGTSDPLLGRPFALLDTVPGADGQPWGVDILYQVVGKLTGRLAALPIGSTLEVWGPLGNGFLDDGPLGRVGLVAGGVGQAPFLAYARQLLGHRGYAGDAPQRLADRVILTYGTRTAALLAAVADFEAVGVEVRLATDDGSLGHHGYVTDLLARHERPDHLIGCGPEPMLRALAGLAARWGVPCRVSLEAPMACGVGICFSCVARVRQGPSWDYRRICVEGPVFDAADLAWEDGPGPG